MITRKLIHDLPAGTPPLFVYMLSKATRYLKVGPRTYRKHDYYHMPPEDSTEEELTEIQQGMEQICKYLGWSAEAPFENLGIQGFYALMETLHFSFVRQYAMPMDGSAMLDVMEMRHVVTGDTITLYNLVSYAPDQSIEDDAQSSGAEESEEDEETS